MSGKATTILLIHAFAGWLLCAATMGIGMAATTLQVALIIHAVGAPVYFAAVSYVYFTRFNYTRPIPTAFVFVGFVMILDFLVVGLLINRSLAMFGSLLGTWIPFALIFVSPFVTGILLAPNTKTK